MSDKKIIFYTIISYCMIFLYIDPFTNGLGRKIQTVFTAIMLTFVLFSNKSFLRVQAFKPINYATYILITSLIITSFTNINLKLGDYNVSSYTLGLLYALILFSFLFFIEYIRFNKRTNLIFKYFFYLSLLTCIIIDILIFTIGSPITAYYFIGDKFTISYLHIFTCTLYYFFKHPKKLLFFLLISLSITISTYLECSTGLIGTIIVFILLLKPNYKALFGAKKTLLYVLIFSSLSFFFSELTKFSFIQYLIQDVLNEDLTLTGRTSIYTILLDALANNKLFGWGQGNGMFYLGYYYKTPNAQNGLFNYITDYGIIGAISLLFLIYIIYKKIKIKQAYPLLALIFTFIVLSSVEITFNLQFIAYLMLLIPFTIKYKQIKI